MDKMFPEWVFKYGISGILAVWLFSEKSDYKELNTRLSVVESRLYQCYELRINDKKIVEKNPIGNSNLEVKHPVFAILTKQNHKKNENTKRHITA